MAPTVERGRGAVVEPLRGGSADIGMTLTWAGIESPASATLASVAVALVFVQFEPRPLPDPSFSSDSTPAVGVVVPVRDEEDILGSSLRAIEVATPPLLEAGHPTRVAVVLHRCVDRSAAVACRGVAGRH
jgi:hypothetical protein